MFTLFSVSAGAQPLAIGFSPGCESLLGAKKDQREQFLFKILDGQGLVRFWTLKEIQSAGLSPAVADFLTNHKYGGPFHQAIVGLLADGVNHHFATLASTYLDLPSQPLKSTTHGELFFQWLEPKAAPAVHSLILRSDTTDASLLHEALHLRDLNQIQNLVQKELSENQGLLISIVLFKVVDELIVYKDAFAASDRSQANLQFSSRGLFADVTSAFQDLSPGCRDTVLRIFQLPSWEMNSIALFLNSKIKTPDIAQAVSQLVADGCAQVIQI